MAGKNRIGAIIALDGEKEFKTAVAGCNKNLSEMKSELQLVTAQYDGQSDSMEALQAKHEVLSRVLQEQENKQKAVADGLKHAQEVQAKVGSGLEELRDRYKSAQNALEEMKGASGTTAEELEKQEETVKNLADAIQKGEHNYKTAGDRVQDWTIKLNNAKTDAAKTNSELKRNAECMKEAEQATEENAESIEEFSERTRDAAEVTRNWSEVVRDNLINSGTDMIKDMVANAISAVPELEDATRQMQASTGATAQEMQEYKKTLEELYSGNFGDSLDDVAQSLGQIQQYTNETNPEKLKGLAENAFTLRDVFDMDMGESIRGIDALMNHMGLSAEEAFDYVAKGAQNGLDKSGELTDNIAEYAQIWSQAGFDAREMFTVLQNGIDAGAYNLDKVNDFVKEFTISLNDGRVEENLESFSTKTQNMFLAFKNGKVTAKDVFNTLISDLGTMKSKQDALTLASNLWSALGEDNAMSVITSLTKTNDKYSEVRGTIESIKDIKYDSLSSKWEELGRKFQMEIAGPVAEDFLPIAEDGVEILIDNVEHLIPAIAGVGTAMGTVKLATEFGAALGPVTLVGGALLGAASALAVYGETAGEIPERLQSVLDANSKIVEDAQNTAESVRQTMDGYADTMADTQATAQHAETLAQSIHELYHTENRSNEQTQQMIWYVRELNELFPELGLNYDEQTRKMNMTNAAVLKYIESSKKLTELEAGKSYRQELMRQQNELSIEKIKLNTQYQTMKAEMEKLTNGMTEEKFNSIAAMPKWMAALEGIADEKKAYDELTESMLENGEQQEQNASAQERVSEEIRVVNQSLDELEEKYQKAADAAGRNTEATDENTASKKAQAEAEARAAEELRKTQELEEQWTAEAAAQVTENVQKQISMFNSFSHTEQLTAKYMMENNKTREEAMREWTNTVLSNMQTQQEAMESWADNLEKCMERGGDGVSQAIDEGILKKLAEMGPAGADYVAAFANMTDEQIRIANETWGRTMEAAGIGAGLSGTLSGEIEKIVNESREEYIKAGGNLAEGYREGITEKIEDIRGANRQIADAGLEALKDALDEHSPSKKSHLIGENSTIGLANGIIARRELVAAYAMTVALTAVNETAKQMKQSTFDRIGFDAGSGLANGFLKSRKNVRNSVRAMCESAISQARDTLDMHSPSKVFTGMGENSAQSYGGGFETQMKNVRALIKDSMKFDAPGKGAQGTYAEYTKAPDMESSIENAIYNGMVGAMSRVKIENNLSSMNIKVTIDRRGIIEAIEEVGGQYYARTGSMMFNRG